MQVKERLQHENAEVLVIGAKIEADITELETYDERQMFLDELNLKSQGSIVLFVLPTHYLT